MAQRLVLGIAVILAGLFLLGRQFGLLTSQINIASLGILLAGLWLFLSSVITRHRSAFLALVGAWIGAFGGLRLLGEAGYVVPSTSILLQSILPLLLVGVGLDLLFRPRRRREGHSRGVVGDQRIGQDPWHLTGDLRLEHGVGDLRIDLSTATIEPGAHEIVVRQGIGSCIILVPTDVTVTVEGSVGMGGLNVLGEQRGGPSSQLKGGWSRPESPVTLHIRARVGTGDLRILPAGPRRPEGWVSE